MKDAMSYIGGVITLMCIIKVYRTVRRNLEINRIEKVYRAHIKEKRFSKEHLLGLFAAYKTYTCVQLLTVISYYLDRLGKELDRKLRNPKFATAQNVISFFQENGYSFCEGWSSFINPKPVDHFYLYEQVWKFKIFSVIEKNADSFRICRTLNNCIIVPSIDNFKIWSNEYDLYYRVAVMSHSETFKRELGRARYKFFGIVMEELNTKNFGTENLDRIHSIVNAVDTDGYPEPLYKINEILDKKKEELQNHIV